MAADEGISEPMYHTALEPDLMVPMRDGARLATDVYRPAGQDGVVGTPLPTLLVRTPYGKSTAGEEDEWAHWFTARGYVVVIQDCRGCFGSEGELGFLGCEAEDGHDAVGWVRAQPWCDGQVGTWGTSYLGWTQTATAAAGTEGLAAMVPNQSGANGYTSSIRHGGALELRWIAWMFWHSARNTQAALKAQPWVDAALNKDPIPFGQWLRRWPIRPGATQLALVPPYERLAFALLTHDSYDDFWTNPGINPAAHLDRFTDVPTLLMGGWYDSYTRATFELFEGLSARKTGPIKLIVGPWSHDRTGETTAGDLWFGQDAAIDVIGTHLRWYDRWLKQRPNGADHDPPVRIFVMGGGSGARGPEGRLSHGGRWRDEYEWPLARTVHVPYYLHQDGGLNPQPPAEDTSSTTYRFDPADPVPSIGGNVSSLFEAPGLPPGITDPRDTYMFEGIQNLLEPGGFDQRESAHLYGSQPPYLPLAARADVLVFQTDPLVDDLELTGPIEVRLWVTTTAADTDFTAKLIDLYPPSTAHPHGYALNLTDSIIRLKYRTGDPPSPLPPGEITPVTITLYPTSNLFVAGHRIRLDISSSNHPRFDINPNTGEPPGTQRRHLIADNTVFHDTQRPSHIILPTVPRPA
ncbi:CocE/NonD family hydrolase [Spirillospora sp. CA-294931]|uniref:CocE/NonD family hydrolase n=1 Tax=Spirillospora sp. CA-294931 TaxID=3240042 RepID=UPI003D8C5CE1